MHDAVHVAGVAKVEQAHLAHGRASAHDGEAHRARAPRRDLQEAAAAGRHVPLQAQYLQYTPEPLIYNLLLNMGNPNDIVQYRLLIGTGTRQP